MKKLSLCLVNPMHPYLTQPKAQAPLGLLYVAASVRKQGFPVEFVDLSDRHYEDDFDLPDADVYGITGTVLDRKPCHVVARKIKKMNRGAAVIFGGPITLSPEFINWNIVDSLVMGEGEYVIFDVLRDFPRMKQKYIASRILDLDVLPFPARDLLEGSLGGDVFANKRNYFEGGSTVISTSRGCPFACTFCASPKMWGRKIIYRSAKNVAEEIDQVISKYGVRQLRFSDENITCRRDQLVDMCNHLKEKNIAWRASIRVKPNDFEMFRIMKEGGCVEVCFGIESGDPEVLHVLKKGASVKDNREAIVNAKRAGLAVRILFMIGTPGETRRTVDRNIAFLESVDIHYDTLAITNFTPLPGTAISDDPEGNGCEILDRNIDNYNLCLWGPDGRNSWKNLVRPVGLNLEELTANKERMVEYVLSTGKSNKG